MPGLGKGDRSNLCEAPSGPSRQIGPVPFSAPQNIGRDVLAPGSKGSCDAKEPWASARRLMRNANLSSGERGENPLPGLRARPLPQAGEVTREEN